MLRMGSVCCNQLPFHAVHLHTFLLVGIGRAATRRRTATHAAVRMRQVAGHEEAHTNAEAAAGTAAANGSAKEAIAVATNQHAVTVAAAAAQEPRLAPMHASAKSAQLELMGRQPEPEEQSEVPLAAPVEARAQAEEGSTGVAEEQCKIVRAGHDLWLQGHNLAAVRKLLKEQFRTGRRLEIVCNNIKRDGKKALGL